MTTRTPIGSLVSQTAPSIIHVADALDGEGTAERPWVLTPEKMKEAVKMLTWTRKTVFFRAGIYHCPQPIEINFAELFPATVDKSESLERDPLFQMLREGVRFMGEGRGSILDFADATPGAIQFHVHWSATEGAPDDLSQIRQAPLFFWEFTGLHFRGSTPSVLVQFGGRTVEDCAWNSCVFDLAVNNGFRPSRAPSMASSPPSPGTAAAPANAESEPEEQGPLGGTSLGAESVSIGDAVSPVVTNNVGGARGIVMKRVLQSRVELVAACHTGVACVLDCCEFSTINGSFSNGEVDDPSAKRGVSISKHGVGLYMRDCTANGSTSINIEVAFTGIRLVGNTRGNSFGTIVSNNCDIEGCLFDDDEIERGMRNVVLCVVRRDVRQEEGKFQPLFTPRSLGSVSVMQTLL